MILPDLLAPNLSLVFCGTAAGTKSAERKAYYAGPGNRFYPTLAQCGITPRVLNPAVYPELLSYGIGLTDLVKHHAFYCAIHLCTRQIALGRKNMAGT